MAKIKNTRFDFTKKNKRTGEVKCVGYLDIKEDSDENVSLYFYGDIVSATWQSRWYEEDRCPQDIADFLAQIEQNKDITIYFNSGGGDVFAGLAIYNQLRRHEGRKTGYVDGMAASIASVIMFACDELHFSSGAQSMVHKPSCFAWGNVDDFQKVINQLDKCEESILDIYMEHTKDGVERSTIKEFVDAETWFSGAELAQYFDIEIEDTAAVAACASDFFEKYNHVPEKLKDVATQDIVDAVIAVLDVREQEKEEQQQQEKIANILSDLDEYGI